MLLHPEALSYCSVFLIKCLFGAALETYYVSTTDNSVHTTAGIKWSRALAAEARRAGGVDEIAPPENLLRSYDRNTSRIDIISAPVVVVVDVVCAQCFNIFARTDSNIGIFRITNARAGRSATRELSRKHERRVLISPHDSRMPELR